ncbi:gamma-tubulin complex component 3 [Iris pallida]|uniref:Gamma-tubulin complex component 3 n=1 Tax=Iris pallida TaxID=29817 RepID=A0AAX6IAE9_IRIPA|nr:gamma-tubulin complex component 3 [Iris pallida]KAJ6850209.1 gamma-tubulin complex component 3 [Iris pallida]
MDDPKSQELVRDLVLRLLPPSPSASSSAAALRYAHRLLSSRMSPSVAADESAMAESIKRELALAGRHADALSFADLHSKLSLRSSVRNRWALLYLLRSIAEDRRRHSSSSTLLPSLPLPNPNPQKTLAPTSSSSGVLVLSKDPDNIREIAFREFADLLMEETEVAESALVRDILYVSQGIDGRYVKFDHRLDSYDMLESIRIPRSTYTMVRRLSELGFLFRKVRNYINETISKFVVEEVGTVGQAFASALQDELTEYYKLLAVLESQSLNPIPSSASDSGSPANYLSLRRLSVWLAEPMVRMRLMAVLVDRCQDLRGGAMAGAIHGQAQHGDPLVQEFMGRLLRRVCSPLFEMVRSWVLEGELEDVFSEFFIVSQPVKAESLWREGYRIQSSMLPSFISPVLAQRILRTGKSINFLRVCCDDSGWADTATEAAAHVGTTTRRGGLGYGETDALEALVVEAAKRIDRHLMEVIHQKFRFRDHCLAIKRYLLLGQGDFVQYLMDIVGPELSEPANTISSFQLAGLLETAIRASNAQYDDREILDRLKVKMMEHVDGDRGWDVFSLAYDARVPLDTVFTASVMKRYLKVFNYLWKLRRVEHALIGVWKIMKPNCIISSSLAKEEAIRVQFVSVLRRCQVIWNEMNHFVTNFQDYIMFEVLEVSWARFSEEMDAAKDLDDLLAAHEKYLGSIVEKSLLGERSQGIIKTLFVLFGHILKFRSLADRWFERIYELQLRGKSKKGSKSKDKLGSWLEGGRKTLIQHAGEVLRKMGEDLDTIAKEYSVSLDDFISQLPMQQHVDLKFLLFRLDFTEYYSRLSPSK